MKKEFMNPSAEFVSLAAVEQIATSAEYYDDDIGMEGGVVSLPSGW